MVSWLWLNLPALNIRWFIVISAFSLLAQSSTVLAEPLPVDDAFSQVTAVSQLADVQPTDWAFQALQSLVERYGCIVGHPNRTYRGNRALSRYEFAAGLNACLSRINEQFAVSTANLATTADLVTLQRLQAEFAAELAALRGQVDALEVRTATLETRQFSTTTKLSGEVIMAVNAGGFGGDRIIDPRGMTLANGNLQPTVLYRAALILNTSFTGTDRLQLFLDTGSNGARDNVTGVLEPNFGSVLDFSVKPPASGNFGLSRAVYTFKPTQNVSVSIGPNIRTTDYIDKNRYANLSNRDFSTLAFVNNSILFPIFGPAAGAEIEWNPKGPITIRALYAASDAGNPGGTGPSTGAAFFTNILYPGSVGVSLMPAGSPPPAPQSDRGLLGDTYQGSVEVEYTPTKAFTLRLQYSGGELFSHRFDVFGINAELALSPRVALFGRYGYGSYNDTAFGDINPSYWMAGIALPDLLKKGTLAGIAVGQPFIVDVGKATQTNFEAFYRLPLTDNIVLTPLVQIILNPGNQVSNGTIITGTLKTVFSF